jgi:predicted phage-related endonuclease
MSLIIHNLEQGTQEWLDKRAEEYTASEAPAMMNESKFKSRNQLLDEKKTGKTKPVSQKQQEIFGKGHVTESDSREIIQFERLEDFPPVVGSRVVEGLPLLASLDGLNANGLIFEHKLFNATLAENVRNGVLEPAYYWQLEHQMLVFGVEKVLFVVSDGTTENREMMLYVSVPERRAELVAGWHQFDKDLAAYVPEAKAEKVVGEEAAAFPMVICEVAGSKITTNLQEILPLIRVRADREMSRSLETDQDFADKENLNKAIVKFRADLKTKVAAVEGEFVEVAKFKEVASELDSTLLAMHSQGVKLIKAEKDRRKLGIVAKADNELITYIDECNSKIVPLSISSVMPAIRPDFAGTMKGKSKIESIINGVDSALAAVKIEIDKVTKLVVANQNYLRENATDYGFLFHDVAQIINQGAESFQAIVKQRIADHDAKEAEKLEAERQRIRKEEEAKAEAQREQIRKEEERKAEAKLRDERLEADRILKEDADRKAEEDRKALAIADAEQKAKDDKAIKEDRKSEVVAAKAEEKTIPHKVTPITKIKAAMSFAEEMADWAGRNNISIEATTELSKILKRHGLLAA